MRVICLLNELMGKFGLETADLTRELAMDKRTIDKLRAANVEWRLTKSMLRKLMLFAFDHGYPNGIFEIRPHHLWNTFQKGPISIFRAQLDWDAKVEQHLRGFFRHLRDNPHTEIKTRISVGDVRQVEEAMKSRNCIFVGSPKGNLASEIALALLWGARPFDSTEENRQRIPLQFLGMEHQRSSAVLVDSQRHGFYLPDLGEAGRGHVRVDWIPLEEFKLFQGEGRDASVSIVCRQPLGTSEPVTTIVTAGYTGRATFLTMKELTHGEPPLRLQRTRAPELAVFKYRYKKIASHGQRTLGLRQVIEGSGQWGPPWEDILE